MPEKEFENIVRQYKANLYMICYMYAKDSDEANDFFQETLIRLWQGFSQFRGESNINTWLSRICINTCISSLRNPLLFLASDGFIVVRRICFFITFDSTFACFSG